jgi:hypothetical protein
MHLDVRRPARLVALADGLAAVGVRGDDGHHGEDAVAREDLGDQADALHVGVAVRTGA